MSFSIARTTRLHAISSLILLFPLENPSSVAQPGSMKVTYVPIILARTGCAIDVYGQTLPLDHHVHARRLAF